MHPPATELFQSAAAWVKSLAGKSGILRCQPTRQPTALSSQVASLWLQTGLPFQEPKPNQMAALESWGRERRLLGMRTFRAGLAEDAWDSPQHLQRFQSVELKLDELRSDLYAK